MKREITTTVEVDGEIYIFRIQREKRVGDYQGDKYISNELTITTTPGMNKQGIQHLIDVMMNAASQIL